MGDRNITGIYHFGSTKYVRLKGGLERRILAYVKRHPSAATFAEIARACECSGPMVSRVLKKAKIKLKPIPSIEVTLKKIRQATPGPTGNLKDPFQCR